MKEEIAAMFSMSNLKETKFYQEVFTEGVQEGRQEGRQEGEYLAKVATIGGWWGWVCRWK